MTPNTHILMEQHGFHVEGLIYISFKHFFAVFFIVILNQDFLALTLQPKMCFLFLSKLSCALGAHTKSCQINIATPYTQISMEQLLFLCICHFSWCTNRDSEFLLNICEGHRPIKIISCHL